MCVSWTSRCALAVDGRVGGLVREIAEVETDEGVDEVAEIAGAAPVGPGELVGM